MSWLDALAPSPVAVAAARRLFLDLAAQVRPALSGFVALTLLTGCVIPGVLFLVAQAAFPVQAGGSLVTRQGVVVGSALIGQDFTRPGYFHPRPSAAGAGYDATASGGSNFGPANPKLIAAVRDRALAYRRENGLGPLVPIPIDAVTASASGLDPDISPANAALQAPRIAQARGLAPALVHALVAAHTRGPQLGVLGEARVPVLELNLALDQAGARAAP